MEGLSASANSRATDNVSGDPCSVSFACTLIAFLAFRVSAGISRYFSVHDAVSVIAAVFVGGLITTAVLFTFTRLEGTRN